jgi:hypothetical protein
VLRYLDLLLLALALPLFLLFGFSLLGYTVCAGAWLVGRAIHLAAERHVARSLARGNRRSAMGAMAAATLGRVWLVALAILLVGLAEREAGLAGAVLAAALVTVHLGARAVERLITPEGTT